MSEMIPICIYCKHFNRGRDRDPSCAAFPQQIPDAILDNEYDHRRPYKGDHGIQFEPFPGAAPMPFDPFEE